MSKFINCHPREGIILVIVLICVILRCVLLVWFFAHNKSWCWFGFRFQFSKVNRPLFLAFIFRKRRLIYNLCSAVHSSYKFFQHWSSFTWEIVGLQLTEVRISFLPVLSLFRISFLVALGLRLVEIFSLLFSNRVKWLEARDLHD